MVYVPPSNQDLLTSAQVQIHAKRGGVQVPYPKADDAEVLELYKKLKTERDENSSKAKDSGELSQGLHVPPASENPEHIIVAGSKEINKNLSTPGAAPLLSDNIGVVTEANEKADTIDPITGETIPYEEKEKVDPFSGTSLEGRKDLAETFGKTDVESEYDRRSREDARKRELDEKLAKEREERKDETEEQRKERERKAREELENELRGIKTETPEEKMQRENKENAEKLDGGVFSSNPTSFNTPVVESEEEKENRELKERIAKAVAKS